MSPEVGRAVDGDTAIEAVLEIEPDVAVLDFMMPGCDGIEAARAIRARRPEQAIILYTCLLYTSPSPRD